MSNLIKEINKEDESQQMARSIKLGMCRAMSEHGLTPKKAEEVLSKNASAILGGLKQVGMAIPITAAALGAVLGIGSAEARHQFEQTLENKDDPKMRQTKAKLETYKRMIKDLKNNQVSEINDTSEIGSV
jgi:hypothetical protein